MLASFDRKLGESQECEVSEPMFDRDPRGGSTPLRARGVARLAGIAALMVLP